MQKAGSKKGQINFLDSPMAHRLGAKVYGLRKKGILAQFGVFIFAALCVWGFFRAGLLVSKGLEARTAVIDSATRAVEHLREAQNSMSNKDLAGARDHLLLAHNDFENAKESIANLGIILNSIADITSQGRGAKKILEAGDSVALAGIDLQKFYETVSKIKITAQGFNADGDFMQSLGNARNYMQLSSQRLDSAKQALSEIDSGAIPSSLSQKYKPYLESFEIAEKAVSQTSELVDLFYKFLGKGHKTVLVLFQNNNEMRATGGFIGTYGFFRFKDGKILSQKISSVYDLDGQLGEKIGPPGPFHDLTDRFGLRDSNWFADFKQSAKKASEFYEKAGMETPDAVIALTPDMFVDLLELTGPIEFPKYNLTLDAKTFRRQIQAGTSQSRDSEENAPKQMLADFAPVLLQRLSLLPSESAPEITAAILRNLNEKNILLYDRNSEVQEIFEKHGWAGRIIDTDMDYLGLYNSNLGGRKTDLDVVSRLSLGSEVQKDGSIINTLKYIRDHAKDENNSSFVNVDYVRFLVPFGSQLISARGAAPKPYYKSDGSGYLQDFKHPFSVDSDLRSLDASAEYDSNSGITVSAESGKTEFGGWIEVAPGNSATLELKYRMPFEESKSVKHSFLFQKQPGNGSVYFDYEFRGKRNIVWTTSEDLFFGGNLAKYSGNLSSDSLFGIVFE